MNAYRFDGRNAWEDWGGDLTNIAVGRITVSRYKRGEGRDAVLVTKIGEFINPDDDVWGMNAEGKVFCFDREVRIWRLVEGPTVKSISVGNGGIFGITPANEIVAYTALGFKIPGELTNIAMANSAWGINTAGQAFRFNGVGWEHIPGVVLTTISAGGQACWGVNGVNEMFRSYGVNWEHILPGEMGEVRMLSAGISPSSPSVFGPGGPQSVCWALNAANQIFLYSNETEPGPPSHGRRGGTNRTMIARTAWRHIRSEIGKVRRIVAGSAGNCWALNADHQIFRCVDKKSWAHVPGSLTSIASGDGAVWGLH